MTAGKIVLGALGVWAAGSAVAFFAPYNSPFHLGIYSSAWPYFLGKRLANPIAYTAPKRIL